MGRVGVCQRCGGAGVVGDTNFEKLVLQIQYVAKNGRRKAAGHHCPGTAACQSIVDLINNSFKGIATSPDQVD